jgi:mRNA (2'-O-methyladenosine-N6-)-methyltransferase
MSHFHHDLSRNTQDIFATFKHRSLIEHFEPICPHITKDDCMKAQWSQSSSPLSPSGPPTVTICDLVHFRPLLRPHTDPTLGHCSYLNTCYSEPTYAHSPSIPPFPGSSHTQAMPGPNVSGLRGPVSLPSGLGAGGRGKEKAPCRYLHYEVDWDGGDGDVDPKKAHGKEVIRRKPYKLGIGMGPNGTNMQVVRIIYRVFLMEL